MSTPLAVAQRAVGIPVRRTSHLAQILFPYADQAIPSARYDVRYDSSPRCLKHGADASVEEVGETENVDFVY